MTIKNDSSYGELNPPLDQFAHRLVTCGEVAKFIKGLLVLGDKHDMPQDNVISQVVSDHQHQRFVMEGIDRFSG